MISPPDLSRLDSAGKDALILALIERLNDLTRRVEALEADNAALRAENTALRKENAELRAKLKLPPKTPDNSSIPPSRGQKPSGEEKRKLKGKPHAGASRELHPSPTEVRTFTATHCEHCHTDVSGAEQKPVHSYDKIEIPEIKPDVTRVILMGGSCPCCQEPFKAMPPAGFEPGSPFGPNLRALAIYLRTTHAISLERLVRLFSDVFGLKISEGALVNMLADSQKAFVQQASRIRADLLASTTVASDETSMRVGKRNWWAWVFHHGNACCYLIHPNRSKAAVLEFLGDYRPDNWVSDRFGAQKGWAKHDHQFCLAHLIRDAQYAIDAGDTVFAPLLRDLLKHACAIGRRRPELADATLGRYARKLYSDLDALLRKRPSHPEGKAFQATIKDCRQNLFVFMKTRTVPPTNNESEQSIRPCVTFRKVTNCFRSQWGATLYANIRSVLETARRRSIGALQAIHLTLSGKPLLNTG
jgi:transposase